MTTALKGSGVAPLIVAFLAIATAPAFAETASADQTSWLGEHVEILTHIWVGLFVLLLLLVVWELIFLWQRKQERQASESFSNTTVVADPAAEPGKDDPFKTLLRDRPVPGSQPPAEAPSPMRPASSGDRSTTGTFAMGMSGGPAPNFTSSDLTKDAAAWGGTNAPPSEPQELPPEIAARVSAASSPPTGFDRTAMERERGEHEAAAEPAAPPPAEPSSRKIRLGNRAPDGDLPTLDIGLQPLRSGPPAGADAPPTVPRAPTRLNSGPASANDTWSELLKKSRGEGSAVPPTDPAAAPPPVQEPHVGVSLGASAPPQPGTAPPAEPAPPVAREPEEASADPWKRLVRQTQEEAAEPSAGTPVPSATSPPFAGKPVPSAFSSPALTRPPASGPRVGPGDPSGRVPLPSGASREDWSRSAAALRSAVVGPLALVRSRGGEGDSDLPVLTRDPSPAEKKRGRKMKLAGGPPSHAAPPTRRPPPPPSRDAAYGGDAEETVALSRDPLDVAASTWRAAEVPAPEPVVQAPPSPAAAATVPPPSPSLAPDPQVRRRVSLSLGTPPAAETPAGETVPEYLKSADRILSIGSRKKDATPPGTGAEGTPQKEMPEPLRNAESDRRILDLSRSLKEARDEKEGPSGPA